MRNTHESILNKAVAEIRHAHDANADSLFVHFSDGTQLGIVLRPPARLRDARAIYFHEDGEVTLTLEDLLLMYKGPN